MVSWVHVISVGTSILSNYVRDNDMQARRLGISGWGSLSFDHPDQDRALASAARGTPVFNALYEYVLSNPRRASAELNAFFRAVSLFNHSPPEEVGVYLFSSDTGTGYLCASIALAILRDQRYHTLVRDPVKITGLGRNLLSFEDSLIDLIEKVVIKILEWSKKGIKVYLNLTGGFKPESAYLLLAGALAGARRAYYIHETFNDVVSLSLPKLTIDQKLANLIRKLENPYQTFNMTELEELLRNEELDLNDLRDRGIIQERAPAFRKYVVKLIKELTKSDSE